MIVLRDGTCCLSQRIISDQNLSCFQAMLLITVCCDVAVCQSSEINMFPAYLDEINMFHFNQDKISMSPVYLDEISIFHIYQDKINISPVCLDEINMFTVYLNEINMFPVYQNEIKYVSNWVCQETSRSSSRIEENCHSTLT